MSLQQHTRSLADFIVQTHASAHHNGVHLSGFWRENALKLTLADQCQQPDCTFQIVYGRRRTALTIMVGYLVGLSLRMWLDSQITPFSEGAIIGFIIPGLIAIWYQRQGVLETTLSLVTAAILVRMILVLFMGDVTI